VADARVSGSVSSVYAVGMRKVTFQRPPSTRWPATGAVISSFSGRATCPTGAVMATFVRARLLPKM